MKLTFCFTVTVLFTWALQAQTFKGHQIGETTAEFLKLEPAFQTMLGDCQATVPRELTPEEIRERYGRRVFNKYQRQEALGKHTTYWDKDTEVYRDRCGKLVRALTTGDGDIADIDDHYLIIPRHFTFRKGALDSLSIWLLEDYDAVRDDVTSRLNVKPEETPFLDESELFSKKLGKSVAVWTTRQLHVVLIEDSLSVQSRESYDRELERAKSAPRPLDR